MGLIDIAIILLFVSAIKHGGEGRSIYREEDFELEQQLNLLNKPYIKSIQNKDGRIYDCVHLYKQTALDHPNLLHHKIQMRPTSLPKGLTTSSSGGSSHVKPSEIEQLEGGGCPIGTVPIKRVTKEDLIRIRTRSFSNVHLHTVGSPGAHYANTSTKTSGDFVYFGAQAVIVTNNPTLCADTQSSETMISVSNGVPNELNSIDVGWTVNPTLYGDNKTRLYTRWTIDGYRNTGCYNMMCPGFVQTSSNIALDTTLWPISTYNGHQFGSKFSVFRENSSTGNWWFAINDNLVGYWPGSIFTSLNGFASTIVWGGATRSPVGVLYKPEMGSGHFPSEGFGKASLFEQLQLIPVDEKYEFRDLGIQETEPVTDKPNCYGVGDITELGPAKYSFYFGGPGGICGY
ncbi:putative NEP-interacting protein [Thalictrum thalictroides]|uniref:Putative NEP-interacting protein n=1 Tax=Thalictrum thalictroides TaxID=46969 RepID=A0A7J6W048_THATH|nr:putative NEP-interacting protein [Thalictrum thalictroides]